MVFAATSATILSRTVSGAVRIPAANFAASAADGSNAFTRPVGVRAASAVALGAPATGGPTCRRILTCVGGEGLVALLLLSAASAEVTAKPVNTTSAAENLRMNMRCEIAMAWLDEKICRRNSGFTPRAAHMHLVSFTPRSLQFFQKFSRELLVLHRAMFGQRRGMIAGRSRRMRSILV